MVATWRKLWLTLVVATTACAHAKHAVTSTPYGSYRFSGVVTGFEVERGAFDVNASGRIASFSGTCRPTESQSAGASSAGCRIQSVSIAGQDEATLMVAVKVSFSESTPWPGDPTRWQVRNVSLFGQLPAARVGR